MIDIIQSAGGIIYYLDAKDEQPRYLLIKRQARSKKIERVAPKGKMQDGETLEEAAMREVSEETGLPLNSLKIGTKVGVMSLRNEERKEGLMDKDMTFYLMEYTGDPTKVSITDGEGYIGIYKRFTFQDVLHLVYYNDMRELMRNAHHMIVARKKKDSIKKDFLKKLDI